MSDESLRLPSSTFRAALFLGGQRADPAPLPGFLSKPLLAADWNDEDESTDVVIGFEPGDIHLTIDANGDVENHFHSEDGESPWSLEQTGEVLGWALVFALNVRTVLPALLDSCEEAAEWFEQGLPLYVPDTEPVHLDLVEATIPGSLLTLPWLGAGHVVHEHVGHDHTGYDHDDAQPDYHQVALLWTPGDGEPDQALATAGLNPETGQALVIAHPEAPWDQVGLSIAEVTTWFEAIYENNHMSAHPAEHILVAALERIAGIS